MSEGIHAFVRVLESISGRVIGSALRGGGDGR